MCIVCDSVTVSTTGLCAQCGGGTIQHLDTTESPTAIAAGPAVDRSLNLSPGTLTGLSSTYVADTLRLLLDWVTTLLPLGRRIQQGAAFSPPFIVHGELVAWVIESPHWESTADADSDAVPFYDTPDESAVSRLASASSTAFFARARSTLILAGPVCPPVSSPACSWFPCRVAPSRDFSFPWLSMYAPSS